MKHVQNNQAGLLSIESKNIFTILKKWLYTEQDIVFRELISNATDAIEKLNHLKGKYDNQGKITVKLDLETNCLVISDNGIGMTEEEVHKYINQIAFSGATEFINQNNPATDHTIIGHFGVGFYSAFMLADHVAIETKSYQENTSAVRWDCQEDMSYSMSSSTKSTSGTDVILYLDPKSSYLHKPELVFEIIKKYFIFSKIPIIFKAPGYNHILVNELNPAWKKTEPLDSSLINNFYKQIFADTQDPLFWLKFESVDLGVRGILFFRNTKNGTEELDGSIKVYSRGVYIGENIPQLIPKFVNLQSGIIECDHLSLTVSRSNIREDQPDNQMADLIYECLTQEVTIALNNMFQNQREDYERHWPHLNAFIKYGVLQDKTFASVMTRKIIFKDLYGHYYTLQEYLDKVSHPIPNLIYYASDKLDQAYYIDIFKKCQLNALLLDHMIDQPLIHKLEVLQTDLSFMRIDSNIDVLFNNMISDKEQPQVEALTKKLKTALGERLVNIRVKIISFDSNHISTLIINDENSRRMVDMLEIYGTIDAADLNNKKEQSKSTLLVNLNHDIIQFILESENYITIQLVANQLLDLSLLSQQALEPHEMVPFLNRSEAILAAALKNLS